MVTKGGQGRLKYLFFLNYRKSPLISTYVFSGLATERVLIFRGPCLLSGGGGGYDKAD